MAPLFDWEWPQARPSQSAAATRSTRSSRSATTIWTPSGRFRHASPRRQRREAAREGQWLCERAEVTRSLTVGPSTSMNLLWLSCLADYAFYVPIELAHFAAVPGFAVPDPDHAGVVGDGPGE